MAITTRTVREMPSAFSIENILEPEKHLVKVCAYARVSTDRDEQEESFERQCEHYRAYINANWEWEFCGVYADQGITGTKAEKRPEFMRLISDCLNNKIDKVLVKSISRFARNTVDALKYIRLLKDKNISVYFETNKMDTLTPGGEVLITVLAAMAEEESRSMSSNIKWTYRKKHERGEYTIPATMMGYKKAANGDGYEIVPEEAKIIQRIFREYVGGMTTTQIAKALRDDNIKTPMGNSKWTAAGVAAKLANEKYMGAAILGKTYKPDLLSTRRVNNGEAPRYYVEHGHPAIVSKELYELAQMEKQARNTANDEAIG